MLNASVSMLVTSKINMTAENTRLSNPRTPTYIGVIAR